MLYTVLTIVSGLFRRPSPRSCRFAYVSLVWPLIGIVWQADVAGTGDAPSSCTGTSDVS